MSAAPLPDRRAFLGHLASMGLGSTPLPGVLWAKASAGEEVTVASVAAAEEIAGITLAEDERAMLRVADA